MVPSRRGVGLQTCCLALLRVLVVAFLTGPTAPSSAEPLSVLASYLPSMPRSAQPCNARHPAGDYVDEARVDALSKMSLRTHGSVMWPSSGVWRLRGSYCCVWNIHLPKHNLGGASPMQGCQKHEGKVRRHAEDQRDDDELPGERACSNQRVVWLKALRGGGVVSSAKRRTRVLSSQMKRDAHEDGAMEKPLSEHHVESEAELEDKRSDRARPRAEHALARKSERGTSKKDAAEAALKGTREDRLQLLVGKDTETEKDQLRKLSKTKAAVVSQVLSLRAAMQQQNQGAVTSILRDIASSARAAYAPGIWAVGELKTGGFAVGDSGRQQRLQRSTTAVSKSVVLYDGSGATVEGIRRNARELCLPNPTDEVLGIDEYTELRLALHAANETRDIPWNVSSNREIGRYVKAMIADMGVPEDVAVKYWLTKRREKRAQELVLATAKREEKILQYATYLYMMAKVKAVKQDQIFDHIRAEQRAMTRARYVYEVEPYKQQKMIVRAADDGSLGLEPPTLVKPKRRRPFKLKGRRGPRRKLNTAPKKVKVAHTSGKTSKSRGDKRSNKGFGSQRKKRSGLSGGKTGASRFKKRKG